VKEAVSDEAREHQWRVRSIDKVQHVGLVGKRLVDFLLVLTFFARCYS